MTVPTVPSVRRRVAVGATFMILLRLSFRTIGFVNTLILVRLLLPADFGLVGLATLIYSIFDTISQLSFQLALIRMPNPQRAHYDTAWTMGLIRAAVIAVLVVATAPLLADFIGEPRVIPLSYVLAGLGLMAGIENVALVDFQRKLQYDRIFWYQIAGKIAGVGVAIPAAFLLRNYWALICGIAASRVTTLIIGYAMKPYWPRLSIDRWRDLFNFSKWLIATNVFSVLDGYCMTLTVGRIAGTTAIGIYQVAYEVGALPASEVAAPIRDPIYAGYSQIADELSLLRKHFLGNLSLLIAVITPMSVGICLLADPITALFLGPKWMAAVPLVRLTALYALFEAIGHSAASIYMTLHRQRQFVELYALIVAIRVPAIVGGAYIDGVFGATFALALTAVLNMVFWNGGVPSELGVRVRDFWSVSWRTIVATMMMISIVTVLLEFWRAPGNTTLALIRVASICLVGAFVQIIAQYCAWLLSKSPPTAEADVLRFARTLLQRTSSIIRRESSTSA